MKPSTNIVIFVILISGLLILKYLLMSENKNGFDPNEGILYTLSKGVTNIEDMLTGINSLTSNKLLPRNLKILEDAQDAIATFSAKELNIIIQKLEEVLIVYDSIKHAVVHKNPKNTALSMLIGMRVNNPKYSLATFSTIEAAKEWVLSNKPT